MSSPSAAAAQAPAFTSLFNDPRFHALSGADSVLLAHEDESRLVGTLGGALVGGELISGHSAPFGGFDFARDREIPAQVGSMVDGVLAQLAAMGVERATLRLAPACHHASYETVAFTLLNRGFTVVDADLDFFVDLRRFDSAEAYVASLRSPARRALKHAAGEPWSVGEAGDDPADWDRGFALLAENRESRGRQLSIDRAYVERIRHEFAGRIRLLELRHDGRPVASALTYKVRPGIELAVAWGDAGHDLPRSPMNRLAYEVVARALREGTDVLDLGTSTLPDEQGRRVPNDGLIQFKHSVGAASQVRLTLTGDTSQ